MWGSRAQQSGSDRGRTCLLAVLLLSFSLSQLHAQDYKPSQTPPPTLDALLKPMGRVQKEICGKTQFQGKIYGGSIAKAERWPWQASLIFRGRHICGAVLIDKNWVASAAHCFKRSLEPSDYRILLGYNELGNPSNYSRQMTLSKVIVHEDYNKLHSQEKDIVLIQLHLPVRYSSRISPVCVPDQTTKEPSDESCWISGWGMLTDDMFLSLHPGTFAVVVTFCLVPPSTEEGDWHLQAISPEFLQAPFPLLDSEVFLMNDEECEALFQTPQISTTEYEAIKDDMICAGDITNQKSTCRGDSGGPLVCLLDSYWYLVGLASWSGACLEPIHSPSIFTRVSHFSDWIEKKKADTPDVDPSLAPLEETAPSLIGWRNYSAGTTLKPSICTTLLSSQVLLLQSIWLRIL